MPFRSLRTLILLFILIAVTGCGHAPVDRSSAELGSRAAKTALTMIGKPYRYGGNTPDGFDCSGLVQYSYGRVGIMLPHGTKSLLAASYPISRKYLQRGDLVFYTQEGKQSSHVALYVGGNQFVHAPSSGKYVYVSDINDPYWRRHFAEARRLDLD